MAKITKKENEMLDLIRKLFSQMSRHSDKDIRSIHVNRSQHQTLVKMRDKVNKTNGFSYSGVDFIDKNIFIDGVEIKTIGE